MSRQGNLMAEQEYADALFYMGEAEWRDYEEKAKLTCEWETTTETEDNNVKE